MTVAELLADETRWCKGSTAKNDKGYAVGYNSPDACCWCLVGALCCVYGADDDALSSAMDRIKTEAGLTHPSLWNDAPSRTHKEVLELVTKLGI